MGVLLPGKEVERKTVDPQEWYQELMGHQHAFQVVSYHSSGCVPPGTASLTTKLKIMVATASVYLAMWTSGIIKFVCAANHHSSFILFHFRQFGDFGS